MSLLSFGLLESVYAIFMFNGVSYIQNFDLQTLNLGANSMKITNQDIINMITNEALEQSVECSINATYGNVESGNAITKVTNLASVFIPRTINVPSLRILTTASKDEFDLLDLITNYSTGALSYVSSDTSCAIVDESGHVTLLAAGTATITISVAATATHSIANASITLSVTQAPLKLIASAEFFTLDNFYSLNAIALVPTTYATNSYTPVGQSLTHGIDSGSPTNIVKMSADGNKIVVGGIAGNNAGIVRRYSLEGTTWIQTGGDIIGSYVNAGAGFPFGPKSLGANTISMSADGNLLTIIESGYGYQTGSLNVFKYDASKTTEQPNPSLPNYGPTNWSRVYLVSFTGTKPSAVISADGKTIAVTDGTLRMYRSTDGGTTWTQRGPSINDPAIGIGFSTNVSISADGLSVFVATEPEQTSIVKAQLLVYEWDAFTWRTPFVLGEYSWGVFISTAISADGKVCLVSASNNNNTASITRYTKDELNMWVFQNTLSLDYSTYNISMSADAELFVLTRRNYNQTTYGDAEVHRWNGTAYIPIINNRTITNRTMAWYGNTIFNATISSDGTRLVVGGIGKVDVIDLNVSNKITYTSSDTDVAIIIGKQFLTKTTGSVTITATQSGNTDYETIFVS